MGGPGSGRKKGSGMKVGKKGIKTTTDAQVARNKARAKSEAKFRKAMYK